MNIRLFPTVSIFAFCWLAREALAYDDFSTLAISTQQNQRNTVDFLAFSIRFDVFEVKKTKLIRTVQKCNEIFPDRNYLSMFITEKNFGTMDVLNGRCLLYSRDGADVADFFGFAQCPFFPTEISIAQMSVKSTSDFAKVLGMPIYQNKDFSYIGFFNIRDKEKRFCWFFLEHASGRFFVGVSKPSIVEFKRMKTQEASKEEK